MNQSEIESHPCFDQHEVVKVHEGPHLTAIIAVHNTRLGPAAGGCRMYPYASTSEALADVLNLSRSMTYKSAMAGVPLGGGKSVIIGCPRADKTDDLLREMGDFVESFGGTYITAEDVGTSVRDMSVIRERTKFVAGLVEGEENDGDPSPITALGVFEGIAASVKYRHDAGLEGVRVGVQGVGKVGYYLVKLLAEAGAEVAVADISDANLQRVLGMPGVTEVSCGEILSADVDVLAPSAFGGVVNPQTVGQIKAGIIAGTANNQLASPDMGQALMDRGILYAPDYVINAGGIIAVYYQLEGQRDPAVEREHVGRIGGVLRQIFELSDQEGVPTNLVADRMAEAIFGAGGSRDELSSVARKAS